MKKRKIDSAYWWRNLAIAFLMILIAMAAAVTARFVYHKIEVNHMIRECRDVWIACRLVALEYYGENKAFLDDDSSCGLTKAAEREVRNHSGCTVDFRILQWDEQTDAPSKILYTQYPYEVEFTYKDGTRYWEAWRRSQITSWQADVSQDK